MPTDATRRLSRRRAALFGTLTVSIATIVVISAVNAVATNEPTQPSVSAATSTPPTAVDTPPRLQPAAAPDKTPARGPHPKTSARQVNSTPVPSTQGRPAPTLSRSATPQPEPAPAPQSTIAQSIRRAYEYGRGQGLTTAIAVIDQQTGELYSAGDAEATFGSASVMKLFIAAKLLATGDMQRDGNEPIAYEMITRSDDADAETLMSRSYVGGTSVIAWAKDHYSISDLGSPSPRSGCWGNTQITAHGVVQFFRVISRDPKVGPWLTNALHHFNPTAFDGHGNYMNQSFGIAAATTGAGVKQGWGHCSSNTGGTVINSTGLVDDDRYAVAILSNTNAYAYDTTFAYSASQANVVTQMARLLMPSGHMPDA
jgi:hypothetical protein